MNKFNRYSLAIASALVFLTGGIAAAATPAGASRDENKLKAEITMLNADARLPQADKIISKQFTDSFSVGSDKISSLLVRNMQYGEIGAILAFAQKMPGGITDANINQVVTLWKKQGSWDQIARSLKVNISDAVAKLSTLEETTHRNIKQALAEMPSGAGAGGDGESGGMIEEMPDEATGGTGTPGDMGGATGGTGTYDGGTGGSDMSGESSGGYGSGNY